MKVSKLFIILVSVVFSVSFVFASDVGPIPFESYDKDGDGFITEKEYNVRKNERMTQRIEENRQLQNSTNSPKFSYFDINGDGKINKNEFTIRQQERIQKRINQKNKFKQMGGKGSK